jgi:esterase/lipase superfamily enzyme
MKKLIIIQNFLLLILFVSCAHEQNSKVATVESRTIPNVEIEKHRSINILVATNRKIKSNLFGCTNQFFGIAPEEGGIYRLGACKINVPKDHTTGEIEYNADPRSNSHQFFKIVGAKSIFDQDFIENLKKTKRIPLVFVHGFNVKYQEAILRASQLAYDLKYQGPVVVFTWPAGANEGFIDEKMINKTYEFNQKNAATSVNIFKGFLKKFFDNDIPVNLMVHSMGHQVVIPALSELGKMGPIDSNKQYINELILNAPDYEVMDFLSRVGDVKNISRRITLYCSYNDKTMIASNSFNKNDRLGACATVDGVDTINVSAIDDHTFGLGHSYYSSRAVLTDVFQVLFGIDVEKRLFIKKSWPNGAEKYFLRN